MPEDTPVLDDPETRLGLTDPLTLAYRGSCPGPPYDAHGDFATPQLVGQGRGRSWTDVFGPAAQDYPGVGAVVGRGDAVAIRWSAGDAAVCAQPASFGHAARLGVGLSETPIGTPSAHLRCSPGPGEDCFEAVQRTVDSNVQLVVLEPEQALLRAGVGSSYWDELARLRCHLRVYDGKRGVATNLALSVPLAELSAGLAMSEAAELLFVTDDGGALRPELLRSAGGVLRSRGKRLALDVGLAARLQRKHPSTLAQLALAGATVDLADREEPRELTELRRVARDVGGVGRSSARVGLLLPPSRWRGAVGLERLSRLEAELDQRSVSYRPVALRPVDLASQDELRERLSTFEAVIVVEAAEWSKGEVAAVRGAGREGRVFADSSERGLPMWGDSAAASLGDGSDDPRGFSALPVIVGAKGIQRVHRTVHAERNAVIYRLFDVEGGAELELPPFRAPERVSCRIRVRTPGGDQEQTCPQGPLVVSPEPHPWVVVEHSLEPRWKAAPGAPVVDTPASGDGFREISIRPPGWATHDALSYSMPEFVSADGLSDELAEGYTVAYEAPEAGHLLQMTATHPRLAMKGSLTARDGGLDVELTVTNTGEETLQGLEALTCLSTDAASTFVESGHGRTWVPYESGLLRLSSVPNDSGAPLYVEDKQFALPLTIQESLKADQVLASAFESSSVVGGNGGSAGTCIHARPQFGDLAPGETATRRGRIWVGPGTPAAVLESYQAEPLEEGVRVRRKEDSRVRRYPCGG